MNQDLQTLLPKIATIVNNNLTTFQDLAQCSGVLYKYKQGDSENIDHCPCTLFPKILDYKFVADLKVKQRILQKLIDKMSRDFQWYNKILQRMSQTDGFVRKMLEVQQKVENCETSCVINIPFFLLLYYQKFNFCIVRNDLMHHTISDIWYQVEYNCIAISFGFISDKVQKYHQMLLNSQFKDIAQELKIHVQVDENAPVMIDAIIQAFLAYNNPNGVILCVVSEFEGNMFDQRFLELELARKGIVTIRTTFKELRGLLQLDNTNGRLTQRFHLSTFGLDTLLNIMRIRFNKFLYFLLKEDWEVREKIELSRAIKCPSLNIQLVNFKKLQEILQEKSELQRFLDPQEESLLRENFCRIWGFDDVDKHQELIEMIKSNPEKFVLKPQREGGGNNYFDEEILQQLEKITPEERFEYILMERIVPTPELSFQMRRGNVEATQSISEIGIIGYFLSQDKLCKNEVGGYLLRTKKAQNNEGGVATGYAVIDSIAVKEI